MKKTKKNKTVKAWAFSALLNDGRAIVQIQNGVRKHAKYSVEYYRNLHATCGPIVRIEVPAPKEAKP